MLTCDTTLAYSLHHRLIKYSLTELEYRRLSHTAKAGLPREAYINVLNKTDRV